MVVLFLRTFNYIFPYFFSLNNEYASGCVRRSFSARHFPSAVDVWLSSHIDVSATLSCLPLNTRLALPLDNRLVVGLVPLQSNPPQIGGLARGVVYRTRPLDIHQRFDILESNGNGGHSLDANFVKVSLSHSSSLSYLIGYTCQRRLRQMADVVRQ